MVGVLTAKVSVHNDALTKIDMLIDWEEERDHWHATANALPMNQLNRTRTNVIDRRRFHQVLQVFSASPARS
jgi:hypothetical protein